MWVRDTIPAIPSLQRVGADEPLVLGSLSEMYRGVVQRAKGQKENWGHRLRERSCERTGLGVVLERDQWPGVPTSSAIGA